MEYCASKRVLEQLQMDTTIKTEEIEEDTTATHSACTHNEIDINHLKQETGLVQPVKNEPAVLVKTELAEDSSEDDDEQQCAGASTPAGAGSLHEANRTSPGVWINVKPELEIGPTVLQHMDIHYALNESTVDGSIEAMRLSGVKQSVEDKLRVCSVHVMRMDVFQCDLCRTVYAEKHRLLQHLQDVHACLLQTSLIAKSHKTNEQTAADNKATSLNLGQMTTEVVYDETRIKSYPGQQKYLQKHLHQQHRTRSIGFKCDKTVHEQHLLSVRNKLHQQNNRNHVTTIGAISSPSNQSKDKRTKTKQKPIECEVSKVDLNLLKHSHSTVELKNYSLNYDHNLQNDFSYIQGKDTKGNLTHTRKKSYCRDEKFAQSGDVTKRVGVQTDGKPFQCNICDARYAQNGGLTQHMRVHTGEKPYQCKICDARFARSSILTRHMKVHTGEKPFQCKICDARFSQNGVLTRHMTVHTDEKPFQCVICDAKFKQCSSLIQHMKIHRGVKPFQCKICDAKFAQSGGLTHHMRVHTGEKPFHCKICDAKFAQSGGLTHHMRVHTGEKPFQCKICDARFAQSSNLTSHMRVHSDEITFQCHICDARFAHMQGLTPHLRVHRGEKPFQCKICDARFARSSHLTSHMRVHTNEKPFQCKICDARFARSSRLTSHMTVHADEKPFQCTVCDASFKHCRSLTQHARIHTGEKPFQCKICEARFTRSSHLTSHMRVHTD